MKIRILFIFTVLSVNALCAQVGIGFTSGTPDASAVLDVKNTSKGVLIPRVSLSDVTDALSPVNTPATSLLVYNTNATVTGGNGTGVYYFNGTIWVAMQGASTSWSVNGNSNTVASTNFLGTTDAQDLVVATNSVEAMRVDVNGNVGIGTNLPTTKLHISNSSSLTILLDKDFEDSTIAPLTTGGDNNWEISANPANGAFAAQAPSALSNNQTTFMEYVVTVGGNGGNVSFNYATSTETGFDWFRFYINGAAEVERNGINGYASASLALNPGTHTLRWEYSKDVSFSSGADTVYVDDILITENADAIFRISDGNELANKVLTTDALGNATWQDLPTTFSDDDWRFNSGTSNTDPIHHIGPVLIGQSAYLASVSDFYVNNGLTIGTQVGLGSVEFIIDDLNATLFSDNIEPLTDNTISLGNATNRWEELYSFNGVTATSDAREKKNIEDLNYGLNDLLKLRPVTYKWANIKTKDGLSSPKNQNTILGFIAQELNEVIPEVVHSYEWLEDENGTVNKVPMEKLGVTYSDLIPVLIKGIQEQQNLLENIKKNQKEISNHLDKQ